MKETNRILFISLLSCVAMVLAVYFFVQPAFIKIFDLSQKDTLGTAIGGLTAPVIGLVSTILLYLALSKQTESNNEQRLKNESDIIFLLMNQLDQEVNLFSTTESHGFPPNQIHDTKIGASGLRLFCHRCKTDGYVAIMTTEEDGFRAFQEAPNILYIIESFSLIVKRIELGNLSPDVKELFNSKLQSFYELKLREGLEVLSNVFKQCQVTDEPIPKKIIEFVDGR